MFAAITSGEALLDRSEVEASQPATVETRHTDAWVTVYYPNFGNSPSFPVWCGLLKLARARKGHKFTLTLPPGKYVFRLGQRGEPLSLEAKDGGEHYLKVIQTPLQAYPGSWRYGLSLVEHDVGEVESADTFPAGVKDAPDVSKLDLAQLQAEPPTKKHR